MQLYDLTKEWIISPIRRAIDAPNNMLPWCDGKPSWKSIIHLESSFSCNIKTASKKTVTVYIKCFLLQRVSPDSKVHGAKVGPTWVLSAPDGPHVGPMNLAIRVPALSVTGKVDFLSNVLLLTAKYCLMLRGMIKLYFIGIGFVRFHGA